MIRITDQSNAFFGCLFDKAKESLKFLPDGIKFNFRAEGKKCYKFKV